MLTTLTHGIPGLALPVMLGIEILWAIIVAAGGAVFHHLPAAVTALFGILFLLAASAIAGAVFARRRINVFHHRGAVLVSGAAQPRRASHTAPELTLAGQPVAAKDETKHFKLIGSTGTGKSTAIRELLAGALARGDRAVIADPDGSYLKHFHDPARGAM